MAQTAYGGYPPTMTKTLTISDQLAAALEVKRRQSGMPSLDSAAEVLLAEAIASDMDDLGLADEALRALIEAGEASGPCTDWDPQAVRDEVRRRFESKKSE